MNMNRILPVKYPIITSYPQHANTLSIISTEDDYIPWFLSNYVQLYAFKDLAYLGCFIDHFFLLREIICPWLTTKKINRQLFINLKVDFSTFLIENINLNHYVDVAVDRYYLSAAPEYRKTHFSHEVLVYGYDMAERIFHIADFLKDGKYIYTTASFTEMNDAFGNVNGNVTEHYRVGDYLKGIYMLEYDKKERSYEFDLINVIEHMKDYIYSENTQNRLRSIKMPTTDCVYGVEVYEYLKDYLRLLALHAEIEIDFRPFHILFDHKSIMVIRIEYLNKHYAFDPDHYYYEEYNKLMKTMLYLRNLIIKFRITRNKLIIDQLISGIDDIVQMETTLMKGIIEELQTIYDQSKGAISVGPSN